LNGHTCAVQKPSWNSRGLKAETRMPLLRERHSLWYFPEPFLSVETVNDPGVVDLARLRGSRRALTQKKRLSGHK
jgi:hypothetical protein